MGQATAPRAKQIAIKMGKKSLQMAEGTATLGAAKDCLFRVAGAGVNDHHVNLEFNGAVITVSAAPDAEAITVNGKPLDKPQQLKSGDIIAFGAHAFEIGAISNAPGAFRRTLRRWYIRVPLYLAGSALGLLLIAFVIAWIYLSPARLSGWITQAVDQQFNCQSSIGSLDYTFTGRVEINDFKIMNKPEFGDGPVLQIAKMQAAVSVWDILFSRLNLTFTSNDAKLALYRKMIAGRPSWNFEPLLPAPTPPPAVPPQPAPPAPRGQPQDLGIRLTWLAVTVKDIQLSVDDEFMKRKTTTTADLTLTAEGLGKPLTTALTCAVDSNGRTGRLTLQADAHVFNKDGLLDLFTADPPRLKLTPGDLVSSLPLQALIDHLTLPPAPAPGEKERVYTAADLPIEPNLLGQAIGLTVQLPKPGERNPDGSPLMLPVQVPLTRLGDLGITWSNLTVASIDPLKFDLAGALDLGEIGRHRAARLPGETPGDWVDGDRLHLDIKKLALDQTAGTVAIDTELTVANPKQGQTLRTRLTANATHLDLDQLQAGDPQKLNAALRQIQFDNQAQVEINLLKFAGSGLGQLALADRSDAVAAVTSGNLAASVAVVGNLAQGISLQAGAELKDGGLNLPGDKTLSKVGVNLVLDATASLSDQFLPSLIHVKRVQIDAGLGDDHYTLTNLQAIKLAGYDRFLTEKNPAFLVLTAEKGQVANLEKDLILRVNPVLKSLFNLELHDTLQVTAGGNLAGPQGAVQFAIVLTPIDPQQNHLSAAAAQPITLEGALSLQQTADQKKQLGLTVSGKHGAEFFHLGLQSPAVNDFSELATAPIVFTPEQAPHMDLALAPIRERLQPYRALAPALFDQLNAIDFSADPRLTLTTSVLALNQPVAGTQELATDWQFSLGLHRLLDSPLNGKTILPKPTDFDLTCRINPAYAFGPAAAQPGQPAQPGAQTLHSLRLSDFTCAMRNEYVTFDSALQLSDILSALGPDPYAPKPVPTAQNPHPAPPQTLTRLPDRLGLRGQLNVRKEAYELARALLKDQVVLRPLTAEQQALLVTWNLDWDRADPANHDKIAYDLSTQIDPFHAADTSGANAGFGALQTHFESTGLLARLPLPLKPDFNPVEFAFANQARLDFTTPISVDQIVLCAHDNAVTLQLDQNEIINMLNTPLSPLAAAGLLRAEVHVTFAPAQPARATLKLDLGDLYLLAKNEGALRLLDVVKAKAAVPLILHDPRSLNPQAEPLLITLGATAEFKNGELTLRLDDKENTLAFGPLSASFGGAVTLQLVNGNLVPKTADFSQEVVLDLAHIAGLAPLATDLNLAGRLHIKSSAQNLDLAKLLAAPALRPDGAPGLPPLFDPNLNTAVYSLYSAPELTVQPKTAPHTKLQLDFKNFAGDLGGNKTGEITVGVTAAHLNAIRLTELRAVAKPEAGAFVHALQTLQLRASLKVANDQPVYLTEMTGAITPCLQSLGLPEPPPAPATPPPAGQPLQPGALDFLQPLTATLDLDLKNLHYDRYEVDALKGGAVLDQGELQMPEPPTATIYGGAATLDLRVLLIGPTPNIPKIKIAIQNLDYNDFFTRAFQSPGAVAGKLHVQIEGTGRSALNPDLDSLNLTVIRTQSENTEITAIHKTPFFGPLWTAAAQLFPAALPADPGPLKFGSQTLKNGRLEDGFFIFSEFPFVPVDGPLLGYKLVGEGKIKVLTAQADYVTFKVTAIPDKVMQQVIATARQDVLSQANKLIPDKKYYLTDAELDDAAKDMQAALEQFMADGKLFVRGRGPLSHPTPEVTPPAAVSDLLLKVGLKVAQKKVEAIAKKIAEEKLKQGLGNLLGPKKK